jgi:hypothetical protein
VLSGTPSFGAISTGNLVADCERWCRDNLPPRAPAPGPAVLRVVAEHAPRGAFRPGPGWPGTSLAATG